MIKVLVTGGKGDIAKAIIDELENIGGYDIYAPGREQLDVTNIKQVNDYIRNLAPDILINNAGYIKLSPIAVNDIVSEKMSVDINLFGVFNCTGAALSVNKDAMIINIGSSAGTHVRGDWSSYCATKAGVIMATKCWAQEGVRAICVSPGRTATKMRKGLYPDEDQSTLLTTEQFAKVVIKAIDGCYNYGENIDVNINNIKELLENEKKSN